MKEELEEKLQWLVMFRMGGKTYTYMNRTVPDMTIVVKNHHDKYGVYPHRMWVIVDDEVQKVVIS